MRRLGTWIAAAIITLTTLTAVSSGAQVVDLFPHSPTTLPDPLRSRAAIGMHRLMRELAKLTPGDSVTLRVYTAGKYRNVRIATVKLVELKRAGHAPLM